MHPNHKQNSKKDLNEMERESKTKLTVSISAEALSQKKEKTRKCSSPYSKSLDGLSSLKEKRKEIT